MHSGKLLRIILVILILGMATFLIVRNISLKKQVKDGSINKITARDYIPFSNNSGNGVIQKVINTIKENNDDNNIIEYKKNLTKINDNVAGATIVIIDDEIAGLKKDTETGNESYEKIQAVRYVLKENGYIYDYIPKYKKSYLISDTAFPKTSFATFSPSGEKILFQYLDKDLITEKSVLGQLGNSSVKILPDNIVSFSFSSNNLFTYVQKNSNGASVVFVNSNEKESIVYESALSEWNISFIGEDRLLITTKPSEYADGFSYIITLKNKSVAKLFSNEKSLATKVSSNGSYILKGNTVTAGPELYLYNTKDGTSSKLEKMGLVDKCSFSQDETSITCAVPKKFENRAYPDDWYLGLVKTDDGIIKYTTQNKNTKILNNPGSEINKNVDIWKIYTNNSGNMTVFIEKENSELWLYEE